MNEILTRLRVTSDIIQTDNSLLYRFHVCHFTENCYRIHVITGDVSNAGTNSNVFINLYGDRGDSGERKLEKSESHMDKFERDSVSSTIIQ